LLIVILSGLVTVLSLSFSASLIEDKSNSLPNALFGRTPVKEGEPLLFSPARRFRAAAFLAKRGGAFTTFSCCVILSFGLKSP
jgi:hypothetical protein